MSNIKAVFSYARTTNVVDFLSRDILLIGEDPNYKVVNSSSFELYRVRIPLFWIPPTAKSTCYPY